MANTTFINRVTPIIASWLNDVNAVVYNILGNGTSIPASIAEVKTNLSLENVDNTSDATKPISTATQTALNLKVSKDSNTGAATVPSGTTAERPSVPVDGDIRYNETLGAYEGYATGIWTSFSGSAGAVTTSDVDQSIDGEKVFLQGLRSDTLYNSGATKSIPVNTVVDGSAKAWVNFKGTGVVSIREAFNVSSITDLGTGSYTLNFTTALPDTNYIAVYGGNSVSGGGQIMIASDNLTPRTTTALRVASINSGFALFDTEIGEVAVFR